MRFDTLLRNRLEGIVSLAPEQIDQLRVHYEHLERWNRKMNLTSLRTLEAIVERHYAESLLLASKLPDGPLTIVDIGSGPGFPGFPIAVYRPECEITLVESNARKCVFLRDSTRSAANVRVAEQRSENFEGFYDWAVFRAVAWRDVWSDVLRLARSVALLIGERDAEDLTRDVGFDSHKWIRVPWADRRVILLGHVPRETV